jgi:zinc-ribbon domain
MGLLSRLRPGSRTRLVLPPPGVLRRERRALTKAREEELRNLGGLLLEMYRQNRFREELLRERCERLLELDDRMAHVEGLLSALRRGLPPGRCDCGALLVWNAHFCANCGRAAGEQPLVGCAHCGAPLAADVSFCPACGTPVVPAASVEGEAVALEVAADAQLEG